MTKVYVTKYGIHRGILIADKDEANPRNFMGNKLPCSILHTGSEYVYDLDEAIKIVMKMREDKIKKLQKMIDRLSKEIPIKDVRIDKSLKLKVIK